MYLKPAVLCIIPLIATFLKLMPQIRQAVRSQQFMHLPRLESSAFCHGPSSQLHDVSITLREGGILFGRPEGLDKGYRELIASIPEGSKYYMSFLRMEAHTGTHVDAPAHFSEYHYTDPEGTTSEKIDLDALIGRAFVLDIPPGVLDITEEVLKGLHIPSDCERLLLRTDNTRNQLLHKPFTHEYSALTSNGSRYLARQTNIKSVGIDHLSIATFNDNVDGHVELFHKDRVVIPIEGLLLDSITPGYWYNMMCLPIKLQGAEGAPARCVLAGPIA